MKRYDLKQWHSSDKRPSVAATGSLTSMREEMAASVKAHEISGLYPARGFGNDKNRCTVASRGSSSWGIQYWIEEAPEVLYSLILFTPSGQSFLCFTGRTEKQVGLILSNVEENEVSNWRVSGDDGSYCVASYWGKVIG